MLHVLALLFIHPLSLSSPLFVSDTNLKVRAWFFSSVPHSSSIGWLVGPVSVSIAVVVVVPSIVVVLR